MLIHCPEGWPRWPAPLNSWRQAPAEPGLDGRRGYQPRGKVLGGSSSLNAMIYMRGQPADYDHWAAQGNPGWGWADVLSYLCGPSTTKAAAAPCTGRAGHSTWPTCVARTA